MNPIRLPNKKLTGALVRALRPLARILLHSGIGYAEFDSLAKSVFVETAIREFGSRGRPANVSRVASIVGMSRKQVSRIRDIGATISWNPEMQRSPINSVLHYWLFDKEFCEAPGVPKKLPYVGQGSFSSLVQRYVGDLPVGAVRRELTSRGAMSVDEFDMCTLSPRQFLVSDDRDDVLQGVFFSIRNLLETVDYNLRVHSTAKRELSEPGSQELRLERTVWTTKLTESDSQIFRRWLSVHGQEFLEAANKFIGELEYRDEQSLEEQRVLGLGMYYYEQDRENG